MGISHQYLENGRIKLFSAKVLASAGGEMELIYWDESEKQQCNSRKNLLRESLCHFAPPGKEYVMNTPENKGFAF